MLKSKEELRIPLRGNIPLSRNSVCVLSVSSETKFDNSDSSFNKSILTLLYLKSETSSHTQVAGIHYYLLWIVSWHYINLKLTLGCFLIKKVGQWFHQFDHETFSKNVFWSINFALSFCQICYVQKSLFWLV